MHNKTKTNSIWKVSMTTILLNGPSSGKSSVVAYANNQRADQPAHQFNLINTFVILFLKRIIAKLAT